MPLCLDRKEGQRVLIGTNIVIEVSKIKGGRVRLSIEAPPEIKIMREEIVVPVGLQCRTEEEHRAEVEERVRLRAAQILTRAAERKAALDAAREMNRRAFCRQFSVVS